MYPGSGSLHSHHPRALPPCVELSPPKSGSLSSVASAGVANDLTIRDVCVRLGLSLSRRMSRMCRSALPSPTPAGHRGDGSDPVYMNRQIRKFRTDKFDTRNSFEAFERYDHIYGVGVSCTWSDWVVLRAARGWIPLSPWG